MAIAGDPGVRYLLLHVIREVLYITDPMAVAYPDEAVLREAAERYLGGVAERMRGRGFEVETRVVRAAQPAQAILDAADEFGAELIALETQGLGARPRLPIGSVADKVVRGARVPVLVHRPTQRVETSARGVDEDRLAG
jgi:nucleotide-binding universal stress UspA family protein